MFTNVFDIARLDMSYMNVHMSFLKSLKKNIEEKLFSFLLINVFVRRGETDHAVYADLMCCIALRIHITARSCGAESRRQELGGNMNVLPKSN